MERLTIELLAEKIIPRLGADDIEKLLNGEVTDKTKDAIENAILVVEKETREAREFSDQISRDANTKVDAFWIFWLAVLASFVVNLLTSILVDYSWRVWPALQTTTIQQAIMTVLVILLGLIFVAMSSAITSMWRKNLRANRIVYRVFRENHTDKV